MFLKVDLRMETTSRFHLKVSQLFFGTKKASLANDGEKANNLVVFTKKVSLLKLSRKLKLTGSTRIESQQINFQVKCQIVYLFVDI